MMFKDRDIEILKNKLDVVEREEGEKREWRFSRERFKSEKRF